MKLLQKSSTEKTNLLVLLVCAGGVLLAALGSICLGAVDIPPRQLWDALFSGQNSPERLIVYTVRLPRLAATLLAGGGLAVAGVLLQSVFGNPLAAPNIIGVNSGAGFFVVLCAVLFPARPAWIPFAAFAGALLTVLTVFLIARKTGASRITLVLAGVAVSGLLSAGIDALTTFFPDVLTDASAFRIGGVSGITFSRLFPAWILIAVGILGAFLLSTELDILALGDETAKSLGLRVKGFRFLFLMLAAVLAGACVSFAGLIGFVGLMVPHIARRFVGNEAHILIPASALMGAILLTGCDILSRVLFAPFELPLGIPVAVLGGPFFLYLLLKKRGAPV